MYGIDCCYKSSGFPETYKEAMESPDAKHWEEAMREEINSLKENNTFTLTKLTTGSGGQMGLHNQGKPISRLSPSMAKTYKARYVAKGYSQVKDIDYHETFAPTANFTSVRALM